MKIEKYKLKNGETRYRFQIALPRNQENGKRRTTRRSGFMTREQAKVAMTRLQHQLNNTGKIKQYQTYTHMKTFGDVYVEWLALYKQNVKQTTYYDLTKKAERHLLPVFEALDITKIKANKIQKFLNDQASTHKEFHALSTALRRVFKYAYRMGYTDNNEFDKVVVPPESRKNHGKLDNDLLTKDQLKTYLTFIHNECSFETYVYFVLLAKTGMRRGEALALTWSDLKGNKLHIHRTTTTNYSGGTVIGDTPKTKGSDRIIVLDNDTVAVLNQHHLSLNNYLKSRDWVNHDDLMFVSAVKGQPLPHSVAWPYQALKRLQKKFPQLKHIDVHGFRHTYATLALSAGMSLLDLQHQLGHSSYNTTLRYYAKYTTDQKQKADQKMNDFFKSNNI